MGINEKIEHNDRKMHIATYITWWSEYYAPYAFVEINITLATSEIKQRPQKDPSF